MFSVVCCRFVVCGKGLIPLSNIQEFCSWLLWKHLVKNMENLYKLMFTYWIEMKTLWEKEKLLLMATLAVNLGNLSSTNLLSDILHKPLWQASSVFQQLANSICGKALKNGWNGIEHKQLSVTGIWLNLSLKLLIFSKQFLRHYMQKDCKLYKWKHNWEMFCENQS